MNRLKELERLGQSIWLDFLSREFLASPNFRSLIDEDGLRGMTSNPSIFEKAITHGHEYDDDIRRFVDEDCDIGTIFRRLAVRDIQTAADAFRSFYDHSGGADGFISIEVSPYLARDTSATIAEAKGLWQEINRPNLMIKVPATREGLEPIRKLTGEGLNVNITLLFSRAVYRQVAEAYIAGLEMRPATEDLSRIASVASFFVSRIDTKMDKQLAEAAKQNPKLAQLQGKVAIANAKIAYEDYNRFFSGPRWERLAERGARPQRLLWASTGTKNKAYSDVLYVNSLIGPNTINTMPPDTLEAFRDHGDPRPTLESDLDEARRILATLESSGISLDKITDELVTEGVQLFSEAADKLYGALATKRAKMLGEKLITVSQRLGQAEQAVTCETETRTASGDTRRLGAKDKSLWTSADEDRWLGWLESPARELADKETYAKFAQWMKAQKVSDVVLIGMGGSSLGPEVLHKVFGHRTGWPRMHVLDSTDPGQIRTIENNISIATSAFIVSSKSGSTLEPNILQDYFFAKAQEVSKDGSAGGRFIAITDPGSSLEQKAKADGFAHIFYGDPQIGGRYSVLSKFGLVPAAATGVDVARLCTETKRFMQSCDAFVPPAANAAVKLGIALGVLATKFKRDKITIIASPKLSSVGAWLEQLIAESTGKQGKGVIPVDAEPLGAANLYDNDRVFLNIQMAGDTSQDLSYLERAGHPIIDVGISDAYQIGQLFFLAEVATAMAGAVIGINPFDQPDVEAAKLKARDLTKQYESGQVADEKPIFTHNGLALFADDANAAALGRANTLTQYIKAHVDRTSHGDYFAFLAFVDRTEEYAKPLQDMRVLVRDARHTATCAGFGPRYLHSTGQVYKGGPNSGVFVEITCDHPHDVAIPGRKATFGTVEKAQALGDLAVLNERHRRILRVHLKDLPTGLATLHDALKEALQ